MKDQQVQVPEQKDGNTDGLREMKADITQVNYYLL